MKKFCVLLITVISMFSLINCSNPASKSDDKSSDDMKLIITDIPIKYDGCMVNITILENDSAVGYCGGNIENESVESTNLEDIDGNNWIGSSDTDYKIQLDFTYNDPAVIGFSYIDAILINTVHGGGGTKTVSAEGTIFNER